MVGLVLHVLSYCLSAVIPTSLSQFRWSADYGCLWILDLFVIARLSGFDSHEHIIYKAAGCIQKLNLHLDVQLFMA